MSFAVNSSRTLDLLHLPFVLGVFKRWHGHEFTVVSFLIRFDQLDRKHIVKAAMLLWQS
jgi:hypothetical protein